MNTEQFNHWAKKMMSQHTCWTLDAVHNGFYGYDFLYYCKEPDDRSRGLFVRITRDGCLYSGRFENGFPIPTEGMFKTKIFKKFQNQATAREYAIETLKLTFLKSI